MLGGAIFTFVLLGVPIDLYDSLSDSETDSPNAFSFPGLVRLSSESDSLTKLDSESESSLFARSLSFFRRVALRSNFFSVSVTCRWS